MGIYADALFTKTQQRVLGLLFGQADRAFYGNEIITLAAAGTGTVVRELAKLEKAGLVTARRVGNQKHYQANKEAPIFEELRSLVVKTFGVADIIKEALLPAWEQTEIAFIYGSMAKGLEHAGSDIDLMVIGTISNSELLKMLYPLRLKLGRPVNPTLFTRSEFAERIAQGKPFVNRVLEQPKIYIKGSTDALKCIASVGEPGPD